MSDDPKPESPPKKLPPLPPLKKKKRPVDRNSLTGALFADELIRQRTEQRMKPDDENQAED